LALSALAVLVLAASPALAATQWAWTHKVDKVQTGWFEVIVSKNTQHDFWYAKVACAGGFENKTHKTALGGESTSTGHSTAHCSRGYIPIEGWIVRGGYTDKELWPS
jgi:hypothetical protein